jgi:hypothetical protein
LQGDQGHPPILRGALRRHAAAAANAVRLRRDRSSKPSCRHAIQARPQACRPTQETAMKGMDQKKQDKKKPAKTMKEKKAAKKEKSANKKSFAPE